MHCTTLHIYYTTLHNTTYTTLHCTTLNILDYTAQYSIYYTTLHNTRYTTPHHCTTTCWDSDMCTAPNCIKLLFFAMDFTSLHFTAFTALQGILNKGVHLSFKQTKPKIWHSPTVEDIVENQFITP